MPPSRPNETAVQHDTFFGMTIADAAKKYLNMMKATRSTSDEALPVVIRTPQEYRRLLRATKALAELLHVPPELFI